MSAQSARGYLGISEVLAQLRAEFPDISVSKIRFLETEGLITPARSPAGYRRFVTADVERLRFILAAQRDQYLPLRVIRERLARLDQHAGQLTSTPVGGLAGGWTDAQIRGGSAGHSSVGRSSAGRGPSGPSAVGRAGDHDGPSLAGYPQSAQLTSSSGLPGRPAAAPAGDLLSRRDLLDAAGMTEALLTELETFGLLRRVGRHYPADALEVARTAVALTSFGVEARHLRTVRAAAERESALLESLVAPILRQRGAGARELAGRTAHDCALLVLRLHCALVEGALAEAGLAEPGTPAGSLAGQSVAAATEQAAAQAGREDSGLTIGRRPARDVGGATA